jgi:hypothetical protein
MIHSKLQWPSLRALMNTTAIPYISVTYNNGIPIGNFCEVFNIAYFCPWPIHRRKKTRNFRKTKWETRRSGLFFRIARMLWTWCFITMRFFEFPWSVNTKITLFLDVTPYSFKGINISEEHETCIGLHSMTSNNILTLVRSLAPVFCLNNPVHTPPSNLFKIHFNIIPFSA